MTGVDLTLPLTLFVWASFVGWLWEYCKNCVPKRQWGPDIPLLLPYGVGALLVWWVAPRVRGWSLPQKAAFYAAAMTLLEWLISKWSRHLWKGRRAWSYGPGGSMISVKATLLWTALALILDSALGQGGIWGP